MLTMIQARTWQLIGSALVLTIGCLVAYFSGLGWAGATLILLTGGLVMLIGLHVPHDEEDFVAPPVPLAAPPADWIDAPAFGALLEGFTDPALVIERSRIVRANKAALRLLGSHIVGEDVRLAIRHPAAAERLSRADGVREPLTIEIVGLGVRNQRWAMQIIPIDGAEDEPARLFVHMGDQTGQYASERARVDFVANASHELRTPLAAILGFVETLADPKAGGDAQTRARFLKILDGEARRMQQLVDDLMSLSRIEADKHRLPHDALDVGQLAQEVIDVARHSLGKRGQDIVADVPSGLPAVQGDRVQLSQLLHNLIGNSAKYGRADTPITVAIAPLSADMLRVEVRDEGEGIADDHLPRLTERFYRVDSGRSRALGGTGLGLAIVKHIVERHRGRLDITSALGKGTTVSVLLPVAAEATDTTPQQGAASLSMS